MVRIPEILTVPGENSTKTIKGPALEDKGAPWGTEARQEPFDCLFQRCATAAFAVDTEHRVVFWNRACEELTGLSAGRMLGTREHWRAFYDHPRPCLSDLVIDRQPASISNHYVTYGVSLLLTDGWSAEGWYPRLGGRRRYIRFDAAPIYDRKGELIAAIETLQDITDLKKKEQSLLSKNAELERLAHLDALTNIANRRRLDDALTEEFRRLRRESAVLSLILCDVDLFKKFNDRYGHVAGDDGLRAVAACIQSHFKRPADLVARFGGEEFAVLLPRTPMQGAAELADSLCKAVRRLEIPNEDSDVEPVLTISAGVASMVPFEGCCPEDLISAADEALYKAKQTGRNRACAHEEIPVAQAQHTRVVKERRGRLVETGSASMARLPKTA